MAERSPSRAEASTSGSAGYIEHTVSKLDTLAGVAIKYGVEVGDIKRLNGLTTDLQMFALKTLRIPLPGRHPPSVALTSPVRSRCESSSSHPVRQQLGSSELCAHSGAKHRAMEKRPLTSAMGLLRGYYGLASMSRGEGEGTEMATYKSDSENYSEDEPFSPIYHPPEPSNGRRYSTGDRRATSHSHTRNSCDILMDSCWSVETPATSLRDSSPLMKRSRDPMGLVEKVGEIQVVGETEPWTKEGPIRRRAKGEFGSDEILVVGERVNCSRRNPVPKPRDSNSGVLPSRPVQVPPANFGHSSSEGSLGTNGMTSIEAALLGGKGAVESLISKVRQSASTTSLQDVGKPFVGILAPPGSGVLEGITSAYRRAKAALD